MLITLNVSALLQLHISYKFASLILNKKQKHEKNYFNSSCSIRFRIC
jgi:hypothetical protein